MITPARRLFKTLLVALSCAALLLPAATFPQSVPQQATGAAAPPYKNYAAPQFKEFAVSSFYLPMSDGVRLAVDLVLPKDLPAGAKIPAVVQLTRYWRAREGQSGANDLERFFASYGYAFVAADVRGTGASFGSWKIPLSREEIRDGGEIVSWIVNQPWSNGKVGAIGNSYTGTTAQMLAVPNHQAVKAVIPRHYEFDAFTDVPMPGGVLNDWMVKTWDEGNHQLDLGPGVKPVDADKDKSLLRAALKEHANNVDLYSAVKSVTFRDDTPINNFSIDTFSVHTFRTDIERSGVAINNWGSWLDAGTADAMIRSFFTLSNPQRTIIGAWNHGASQNASPYLTPASPLVMQRMEWLRFFDHHLKGLDTDITNERALIYYTMGEERWKTTKVWPPAGTKNVNWYFGEERQLSQAAPRAGAGADVYKVDFEATTGETNRWRTQLGGPVQYGDRAAADARLLTYTSPPLAEDTEITGYPIVDLFVTTDAQDGAFFVYLEDVDEGGKVTYLTEGEFRPLHRKVSHERAPYQMFVPYHSFKRKDATPVVPGEAMELKFGLLPTSVLVKRGHRIRVAIAGQDRSVFARTPSEGVPTITVERNARRASFIELPVVRSDAQQMGPVNLLTTTTTPIAPVRPAAPAPQPSPGASASSPNALTTVEAVLERYIQASGGRDALERPTSRVLKGKYSVPARGYEKPVEVYAKAPNKYALFVMGDDQVMGYGFNGTIAWDADFFGKGVNELTAEQSAELRREANFYRRTHLHELYPTMTLKGVETVDGVAAYVVDAIPTLGRPARFYFDARTGLLIRRETLDPTDPQPLSITTFEDYREVDGMKLPFRTRTYNPRTDTTNLLTYETITHNVAIPDSKFDKPAPR